MGFFDKLKDATKEGIANGHDRAKADIAKRKEEERRKIELLNEINKRKNKSNKDNK